MLPFKKILLGYRNVFIQRKALFPECFEQKVLHSRLKYV